MDYRWGFVLGLVLMSLVFVQAPSVHASAVLVQQNNAGCNFCGSNTVSVTFSSNVQSGDVLAVGVGSYTTTALAPVTTVTDSLSSSYAEVIQASNFVVGPITNDFLFVDVWVATASSTGADTVTATLPSSIGGWEIYAYELSGVATTGPGTGQGTGSGSAFSTTSTAFQNGAFLLGMVETDGQDSFANGPGFTVSPDNTYAQSITHGEYSLSGVSTPTTFPATGRASGWAEVGIALNPQATPPPIPEYPLGLPLIAILTLIVYGLIKRRTGYQNLQK